jgi:predicted nucleotidyltransferase
MKHHEESIKNMTAYFQENPEIIALFLTGSVATSTEHPNSDIDGVAVVSPEYYLQKKTSDSIIDVIESIWGKCTYEGGYFDVHYKTKQELINISENGTEPMRNMFSCARTLFCNDPDLPELVSRIPVFQKTEAAEKQLRYYCTLKQSYSYFWKICKPEGFARIHTASRMIFCLYRLILLENEMLFPSIRKLEATVKRASNKPEMIIEKCRRFIQNLSDEDALELINSYEKWTSYDYPKNFQFIANNFSDPYECK